MGIRYLCLIFVSIYMYVLQVYVLILSRLSLTVGRSSFHSLSSFSVLELQLWLIFSSMSLVAFYLCLRFSQPALPRLYPLLKCHIFFCYIAFMYTQSVSYADGPYVDQTFGDDFMSLNVSPNVLETENHL